MIRIGNVVELHESRAGQMLFLVFRFFTYVKKDQVTIVEMFREPVTRDENLRAYIARLRASLDGYESGNDNGACDERSR